MAVFHKMLKACCTGAYRLFVVMQSCGQAQKSTDKGQPRAKAFGTDRSARTRQGIRDIAYLNTRATQSSSSYALSF